MTTIGLCMIVKNEAHVIERCLNSVKPLIDFVLIVDTGSTDDTVNIINHWLTDNTMPGRVYHHDWIDFATNRTQALQEMERLKVDYILMIDADEVLEFPIANGEKYIQDLKNSLSLDCYNIPMICGTSHYDRPQLFRNDGTFYFKGVLHEYLERSQPMTKGRLPGLRIRAIQDSARNQNPAKYRQDAEILAAAYGNEKDPFIQQRYVFYWAQCLKGSGQLEKSIEAYHLRAALGGWIEEVYWSLYQIAVLRQQLAQDDAQVIQDYLGAYEVLPSRAEALHGAMRLCRLQNKFYQGYMIADRALRIPMPSSALFTESWIYDYGLLDEFSIAAYYVGEYQESLMASERLINEKKYPASQSERIEKNREFAKARQSGI